MLCARLESLVSPDQTPDEHVDQCSGIFAQRSNVPSHRSSASVVSLMDRALHEAFVISHGFETGSWTPFTLHACTWDGHCGQVSD